MECWKIYLFNECLPNLYIAERRLTTNKGFLETEEWKIMMKPFTAEIDRSVASFLQREK